MPPLIVTGHNMETFVKRCFAPFTLAKAQYVPFVNKEVKPNLSSCRNAQIYPLRANQWLYLCRLDCPYRFNDRSPVSCLRILNTLARIGRQVVEAVERYRVHRQMRWTVYLRLENRIGNRQLGLMSAGNLCGLALPGIVDIRWSWYAELWRFGLLRSCCRIVWSQIRLVLISKFSLSSAEVNTKGSQVLERHTYLFDLDIPALTRRVTSSPDRIRMNSTIASASELCCTL
jgi:hypothetical protein